MAATKVGIDIGKYEIKCAIIDNKAGVYSLVNGKSYLVPPLEGKEYATFLKKSIADFLKESHIKSAALNFTIGHDAYGIFIQFINMPIIEDKLLKKSVKFELEALTGLNQKNYKTKWAIVETRKSVGEYVVFSAMVEKKLIAMLSGLASIFWKIESIEIQPLTIGRLVKESGFVVDFGHSSVRIFLYVDGVPINMETVDRGADYFIRRILDLYQDTIDCDEAVDILKNTYVWSDSTEIDEELDDYDRIAKYITDDVKEMIEEVKRIIRGMEIKLDIVVENYYYTGELSNLTYLIDYANYSLDVQFKPLELLSYNQEELESSHNIDKYTLAASASMFKEFPYYEKMNFSELRIINFDSTSILVGVLCAVVALHFGSMDLHKRYDEKVEEIRSSVNQVQLEVSDYDNQIWALEDEIYKEKEVIIDVNALKSQKKWLSDIFYAIPDETPTNTVVQKVNVKKGRVVINGVSSDYSAIGFLAIALEDYGDVKIDSISDTVDGEIYTDESFIEIDHAAEEEDGEPKVANSNRMNKGFQMTITYRGSRFDSSQGEEIDIDRFGYTLPTHEDYIYHGGDNFDEYDDEFLQDIWNEDNNEGKGDGHEDPESNVLIIKDKDDGGDEK